jgi:hypothetical protein
VMAGRRNDEVMAKVAERIKAHQRHANDPDNPDIAADAMFELEQENEHVFFEALVELESHNVWVSMAKLYSQFEPVTRCNILGCNSYGCFMECICRPS